jgi:rod shape-determining protein MreB and related proteins
LLRRARRFPIIKACGKNVFAAKATGDKSHRRHLIKKIQGGLFEMSSRLFSGISNFFSGTDIALDLGTANTRLFAAGKGLLADVPTRLRPLRHSKRLDVNSPDLKGAVDRPKSAALLRGGAVVDVGAASQLLKRLLKRANYFSCFIRPRILVCAPTCLSDREGIALVEATRQAGARAVAVVPEPLAAAVGAGLEVCSPYAQMIVDIGEGVTDVALIREGSLIQTAATRVAGNELHKAVQRMAKERYQIRVSKKTAELLTIKLGAVHRQILPDYLEVCGVTNYGRKINVTIESGAVSDAIRPIVNIIAAAISRAVREISPELCAEVIETGICLTGGVALLPGIAEIIAEKTDLPVVLAPSPLHSVIDGAGGMLDVSAKTNLWQN